MLHLIVIILLGVDPYIKVLRDNLIPVVAGGANLLCQLQNTEALLPLLKGEGER